MKRVLLVLIVGALLNAAQATTHISMVNNNGTMVDNWKPTPCTNVGLFNWLRFTNSDGSNLYGFPTFSSLNIQELRYYLTNGAYYTVPIQTEKGFTRTGLPTRYYYESTTMEIERYTQKYTYRDIYNGQTGTFSLVIQATYYPNGADGMYPGYPECRVEGGLQWGKQPTLYQNYPLAVAKAGIVLRSDWDPFFGATSSSFEVARKDYFDLTAYQPSVLPSMWCNTSKKFLARLYDTQWRVRGAPPCDIYWQKSPNVSMYDLLTAEYNTNSFYSSYSDHVAVNKKQSSNYNGDRYWEANLPSFCKAANGLDLVAYLYSDPDQYGIANITLRMQKAIGMRSVFIGMWYDNIAYGDPLYKVNINGVNKSLADAFTDLLVPASNIQSNQVCFRKTLKVLTCPDGKCTEAELSSIEAANCMDDLNTRYLNSAVYVLEKNQTWYEDYPDDNIIIGGVVKGHTFRAFVFQNGATKDKMYIKMGHELGHTFGMAHQWSNCGKADNWNRIPGATWNCKNGTLMSYSTTPVMQYSPDNGTWFADAPFSWVSPRWGFGPTPSENIEPSTFLDNIK